VRKWADGVLSLLAVIAVSAGLLVADQTVDSQPAQAADMSQFQPGNIIDDSLFWDANAMTVADIQTFLNGK